jgi:hypothetical protein
MDRIGSNCKYIENFAHQVSYIDQRSRKTLFSRGKSPNNENSPRLLGEIITTIALIVQLWCQLQDHKNKKH